MTSILLDTLVTGLPLVPAGLAILLILRVRDDLDLTVGGSFATGAAVVSVLLTRGVPVVVALPAAVLTGSLLGLVTTGLHLRLRIPVLLVGLVMSLGLFSVNLRILGQPTLGLAGANTMFRPFGDLGPVARDLATIGLLSVVLVVVIGAMAWFLRTEIGLALRTSGVNMRMARAQGVSEASMLALDLALANGLAALAGALAAQNQGYVTVDMGDTSTLLAGIAALLLGELVFRPQASQVVRTLVAVAVGTLLYRLVLVVALRLGLPATDLRLVTALTLILAFAGQHLVRRAAARSVSAPAVADVAATAA